MLDRSGAPDGEIDRVLLPQLRSCLSHLCQGPESHPFVQPLGDIFLRLGEGADAGILDSAVTVSALNVAAEFLAPSQPHERLLEFALNVHTDKATTDRFIQCVAEATPAEWVADWLRNAEDFTRRCQEVWELHAYFVFLDIKGDRGLFEQTAHHLCRALGSSMVVFVGSLARCRPWVEEALQILARQEMLPLFERLHADALRSWHAAWREQIPPERIHCFEENDNKFWEAYFTHLLKITWPDFFEAFEHYHLLGHCPVDLAHQLRLRVDPSLKQQVIRNTWQQVREQHGRIWELVEALLNDALADVGSCVYRPEPLRPSNLQVGGACSSTNCPQEAPLQCPDEFQHFEAALSSTTSPPPYTGSMHKTAKPTPWFPFAHSGAGDEDMLISTPHDLRVRQGRAPDLLESIERLELPPQSIAVPQAWDDFAARLVAERRPWWEASGEATREYLSSEEPLRIAALRAVKSNAAYTHRVLIFRVVSGNLAQNGAIVELPKPEGVTSKKDEPLPSLVIRANGTRCDGITKFGRTSSRRTLLPDFPMGEPIASRSHFNIVYMQDSDRYFLMDAGSKWGTFVKIGASKALHCGDWIRVGGVEFIIRFCGGSGLCAKSHSHYHLHSLRLHREHQATSRSKMPRSLRLRGMEAKATKSTSATRDAVSSFASLADDTQYDDHGGGESSSSGAEEDEDELLLLLSSRRLRGWTSASTCLCQRSAMHSVRPPTMGCHSSQATASAEPRTASSSSRVPRPCQSMTPVPISPLELDFISGPRMGEKIVLCERVCTLGRGEANAIQVNDSQLASVSRVHCIFEHKGDGWHIRDNGSTNGTWRRLSCILEPSDPIPLCHGVSIQAGAHEFLVEEATMRQSWFPSTASSSFDELCAQEQRSGGSSASHGLVEAPHAPAVPPSSLAASDLKLGPGG